ncbi:MAG: MFS transporter [Ginsengibacter sp.]
MNLENINLVKRGSFWTTFLKTNQLNETDLSKRKTLRRYRIATSVFFFIAGLTFATWASRIPAIQAKLNLSDAGLGGVLFSLPVGLMLSLPLSGWMVSKYGSKPMMITGALAYPAILLLLGSASSIPALVMSLFLFGVLGNLLNIAMNTQAVGVESLYGRSVMASFHGLWSLAGFSGALIGTIFVSQGLSPLIHFTIVAALAMLLIALFFKKTLPKDIGNNEPQKLFVKPDKKILLLGMIAFCCLLCEGAMSDWSGVYFKKIVEAPASMITLGYVAFTAMMALGRFLGDWLVTKLGVKNMLQISGTLITSGLLLSVFFPNIVTATLGFLLVGFGVSSVVPIVYGLAGKSKTMSPATALAAVSTIGFLGFLIGPPVIGFIAQAVSLRWSFTLIAILGSGTAILARKLKLPTSENNDHENKNSGLMGNNKPENPRAGFVAWPETVYTEASKIDNDINHGRTRNGGYVAFPKM